MTTSWSIAIVLAVGIIAFAAGRGTGYSAGQAAQKASTDSATVKELEGIVSSSAHLILQANGASNAMRSAVAKFSAEQRRSTKELRDVLENTSGDRLLCRFDADSMRIVRAARENATRAAAGGIRSAVSGTTGPER